MIKGTSLDGGRLMMREGCPGMRYKGKASESILLPGDDIGHSLHFASHVHIPYLSEGIYVV